MVESVYKVNNLRINMNKLKKKYKNDFENI